MKTCRICEQDKPDVDFYALKGRRCKLCYNEFRRTNKQQIQQRQMYEEKRRDRRKDQRRIISKQKWFDKTTKKYGALVYDADFLLVRELFNCYQGNAKQRNLVFELTIEQFTKLIRAECFYCGNKDKRYSQKQKDIMFDMCGVDRTNNSIGYIESNCVTCCAVCNHMKLSFNKPEFIEHIKKILSRIESSTNQ